MGEVDALDSSSRVIVIALLRRSLLPLDDRFTTLCLASVVQILTSHGDHDRLLLLSIKVLD
jgi:hypothetical protein